MGGPVADVGVPIAYEYAGYDHRNRALYLPVEAPPCGDRLVVPDHDIDLRCDLPQGHAERHPNTKHRAIIDRALGHHVTWCNGECARPCTHVSTVVSPFLQRVQRSQP